MTPEQAKKFVMNAVTYALENRDPNLDYGKYVSESFINTIDEKRFNFQEWKQHLENIKAVVTSIKPIFDCIISDGKNVFASYHVKSIKPNGEEILVKDLGHFVIENGKIVYCDELTKLIQGGQDDHGFASMS